MKYLVAVLLLLSLSSCAAKKVLVDDDTCSPRVAVDGKNVKFCDKINL